MARILGVELDDKKQIWIALTKIYGIGKSTSLDILKQANVDPSLKTSQLTPDQLNKIKEIIEENYKVEGDLRREVLMNIRRLKDIGCWRGIRHIKGLPVRGQRTKTNNRTVRGNKRRTVGSGRKPPPSPT